MATKAFKSEKIDALKAKIEKAQVAIVTEYKGYTVEEITNLRRAIQKDGGDYMVVKNTLAKIAVKDTPYECGLEPMTRDIPPVSVRYYRVAMLFILFDIEVVFLYAVATVYREMLSEAPTAALVSLLSFIVVLTVGLFHAWKKRALQFVK